MTSTETNIALSIPDADIPGRYFFLKLKQQLTNEPSEYEQPKKLLAISDIEGNFQPFCRLLLRSKVIDKYFEWTFADGHLVIVGDCFDRGQNVTECLWLIYMLEEKANKNGGKVHYILGNHEIMNLNGDWRYVHPKYAKMTKSAMPHVALYDGNNEIWRWLRTKNIIEKIGNILFTHGGIADQVIQLNLSISEINDIARPFYTRANETFHNIALNTIFSGELSPFWYRGFYDQFAKEEIVDAALKHFNVDKIITGHTPVDHISTYYDGKVINIDTNHAEENSEALLIYKGKFYRVQRIGKLERIKNIKL
jgi:hypothetical protein